MRSYQPSWWRTPALALALAMLLGGIVRAQDYRGRVQGVVTDDSGAAIVGATVTLANVQTSVQAIKQTNTSGQYLFDFVEPGAYAVTVDFTGFRRFVQENVTVMTRGDVTVNAQLKLGAQAETITVTAEPPGVEFNSSTMSDTVVGAMLRELPILDRNPFTLTLLNPGAVNKYRVEGGPHSNPFYTWSSDAIDMGGTTSGKNDLLLDGASLNINARGSYTPPMDAVQEVSVEQNAVDAQYGWSAGGIVNVSMKSGTNDVHGTAYYFGRNPALNAVTNSIDHTPNTVRNHIWGGTIGGPIKKNKLFSFGTFEQWHTNQPASNVSTVPTELERAGDFSKSLNADGSLRVIYDPFTTQFDPATGIATRQPFAGNRIPASMMDATGKIMVNDMWLPNNPGDDASGVNNFRKSYARWQHYWNFSDRTDYNISDRLRVFARFSKFQTRLGSDNWGGTAAVPADSGGLMDTLNASGEVLYSFSPSTTATVRYTATYLEDEYASDWAQIGAEGWNRLWPNNPWYKPATDSMSALYRSSDSMASAVHTPDRRWASTECAGVRTAITST